MLDPDPHGNQCGFETLEKTKYIKFPSKLILKFVYDIILVSAMFAFFVIRTIQKEILVQFR
jgi:hypothetical protein